MRFRGFNLECFKVDGNKIEVGSGNAFTSQRVLGRKLLGDIGIGPEQRNSLEKERVKANRKTAFWHEVAHPIATEILNNNFSNRPPA